jgi:cytochrome c
MVFFIVSFIRMNNFSVRLLLLCGFMALIISSCTEQPSREKRILVFSRTGGWQHSSIPHGIAAIQQLGAEHGFRVDTTKNAAYFTEDSLKQYSAVVFLSTRGNVLDHRQQADFERYIQAGGGFVGIHSATDTEYDWPWYGKLAGAYFESHPDYPDSSKQNAVLTVVDRKHPATEFLPDTWQRFDEWYSFKQMNPDVQVLLTIDEQTYTGGKLGAYHPMAWYHAFDGGRAFYTALGHTDESYAEPLFRQHLLGGIRYAIGENQPLDYSKARSLRVPDETRFTQQVLAANLNEPMELAVADDGRVIFVERHGTVRVYNPSSGQVSLAAQLNVFSQKEDGLLGLALDPDFSRNQWLYLFYSPAGTKPIQRVSRFVLDNDSLRLSSEKILLEIPVIRSESNHSGGSLAFGPDGNLFISLGDNTVPFASDGYAPIDERPGRAPWDAQKSSGNPNDLRGKILRIHPEPDGTYTIPAGNLFPEGTAGTRPEIYVMGNRNPSGFPLIREPVSCTGARSDLTPAKTAPAAARRDTTK